jgi:hypothetical protein
LWERVGEEYPGSTVLQDLVVAGGDVEAAQRILARFAATRLILIVLSGGLTAAELEAERAIARTYIEVLPPGDAERRVLLRLAARTSKRLRRPVTVCAIEAAELAAAGQHVAGAYWLHLTAYALAFASGWRAEALRAARAIERSARAVGAAGPARDWRRRVLALEREPE